MQGQRQLPEGNVYFCGPFSQSSLVSGGAAPSNWNGEKENNTLNVFILVTKTGDKKKIFTAKRK